MRALLLLAALALASCVAIGSVTLFGPGSMRGLLYDLPSGHEEVMEIRARYRVKLDPLVRKWEGSGPEGKAEIEAEAQPVWEDYRREVTEACRRHGLHTPTVRERWAEVARQPWEK